MKRYILLISILNVANCFSQPTATLPQQNLSGIHLIRKIECSPVRDQSTSPTCWVFGTNSLFETDFLKMTGKHVDLSEMFIARYAYLEKAEQFLITKGITYFAGGGQFHDVIRVVEKYGMMPEEVYDGRPQGEVFHDHNLLDTAMQKYVGALLKKGQKSLTTKDRVNLNDTLDKYLGKVPHFFKYQEKVYTARTFADQYIKFNPRDYVELVSFANKPLYKKFILEDKYNWLKDSFVNVGLSDLQMIVDTALLKGYSLGWEGDVTNTAFDYISAFAKAEPLNINYDSVRISNYKSEITERDHMLHLTGVGLDNARSTWYYMKNSWGNTNKLNGYMFMNPDYFKMHTVIIVVNKNALPSKLRNKIRRKL